MKPPNKPLFYVGPGSLVGVPAADLSTDDLARLAWARSDPRPAKVNPSAIEALRDELVASGLYSNDKPKEQTDE